MNGKIQRVPLREVWKHEALDFTTWLENNIDVLNEALGLSLTNPEREQNAGPFSAQEAPMLLITRERAPERKFLLSQVRQGIETTFSQLWQQFVDRILSRSWRGWWTTIQLKVLFYNLVHAGVLTA